MRIARNLSLTFMLLIGFSQANGSDDLILGPPLDGAWYNSDMPGQGLFIKIYQQPPSLFAGWFGFPRPSEGAGADPVAHRWYTLEGQYSGNSVLADIYQTSGGVFVDDAPVEQIVIGTAVLRFSDCNHGSIHYRFNGAEEGVLEIERIVPAPAGDCDALVPVRAEAVPDAISRGETTVFEHVSVLQMPAGTLIPDQMVVVEDGRITQVGNHQDALAPEGAITVDGRGRYLIPGLVDTHTHLAAHAPQSIRDGMVRNELLQYVANGVTSILVPGNGFNAQPFNSLTEQGAMSGPVIYDAQWVFSPEVGGRGEPATAAEARTLVRNAHNGGYQFMKFFDRVSSEVTFAILDEAAKLGMPTIAHLQETVSPADALDGGLDLVAHLQEFNIDFMVGEDDQTRIQHAVEDMVRNLASVTSTLVIDELTAQVAGGDQVGVEDFWARPENRWFSDESIEATELAILRLMAEGDEPGDYDDELAFLRQLTRQLHEAGVPILMGTDAPGSGAVPGFAVHREVQALLNCGIPLSEVLRISSWNGADFIHGSLGLPRRFGAIRNQWRADLVLLDSNPLHSARSLKDIAGVMANGHWLSRRVLDERLEAIAVSYGNK
jgi:imidazolonepropionase-like amidohydrolase